MKVQRIHDDGRSWIEPPIDESWPPLEKLQWHASVVSHDSGLNVGISLGTHRVNGVLDEECRYCVTYRTRGMSGSTGPMTFRRAWTHLSGMAMGARLVDNQEDQ